MFIQAQKICGSFGAMDIRKMEPFCTCSYHQPGRTGILLNRNGNRPRLVHVPCDFGGVRPSFEFSPRRFSRQKFEKGVPAVSQPDDALPSATPQPLSETLTQIPAFLSALYRFTRPHTMFGTTISIISVSLLALQGLSLKTPGVMSGLFLALSSALLMNIFIVGLNQIYDIEIDKINKPYLPLASGEFSMATATTIVGISLLGSLGIGWMSHSVPLLSTLVVSMLLGMAYSMDVPFLRWKRNAVVAAGCVLAIRAVAVQFGFYFHMVSSMGTFHLVPSRPLLCTVFLMLFFSVVIAFFKDIPDVRGDEQSGVRTLSVQLGQKKVFWICVWMLSAMYGGAFCAGIMAKVAWSRFLFPGSQLLMGLLLWTKAKSVDISRKQELTEFYMFIWKLFYSQYLFIPLLR